MFRTTLVHLGVSYIRSPSPSPSPTYVVVAVPSKVEIGADLVSTPNGTPGSSTYMHTRMLPAPSSSTYGWFLIRQRVSGIAAREKKNTVSV